MLQTLNIRNLALMDEVSLEFDSGFTAVTGETGAGKSILLGALSFLSGARVGKSIIRRGAADCEVEAGLFFADTRRIDAVLERLQLPPCEDGSLIMARSFSRQRMPKIRVNGSLTTLANLSKLGEAWIDFHGPGEPQKLFKENWQRELLDLYGNLGGEIAEYRRKYREWRSILESIDGLRYESQLSAEEREFIADQIRMIDDGEVSLNAVESLERDFNRLTKSHELAELAGGLNAELAGEDGVSGRLGSILQAARDLGNIDPETLPLADRLESSVIEIADIGSDYGALLESCEFDEEQASSLHERMNRWLEIRRRYGPTVESVLRKREELAGKIDRFGDLEGTVTALTDDARKLENALKKIAGKIGRGRRKASVDLAKRANRLINALGFKNAGLRIEVLTERALAAHGDTSCRFLFAPSAGEDAMPLKDIASSGEVARVMLALKAVLAEVDDTPLLVFDEVDANIGGEIAVTVGDELAGLGRRHQVFCVTHLPQVAALADGHFVVAKDESGKRVEIAILAVHRDSEERVTELARMLGDRKSDSALVHARELLVRSGKQAAGPSFAPIGKR